MIIELRFVLLTSMIVNSCQEDQRPSGAGYFGGAEAPVANPGSGSCGRKANGTESSSRLIHDILRSGS